jgi:hypothetical protein
MKLSIDTVIAVKPAGVNANGGGGEDEIDANDSDGESVDAVPPPDAAVDADDGKVNEDVALIVPTRAAIDADGSIGDNVGVVIIPGDAAEPGNGNPLPDATFCNKLSKVGHPLKNV